jgi:hypothetical protein
MDIDSYLNLKFFKSENKKVPGIYKTEMKHLQLLD